MSFLDFLAPGFYWSRIQERDIKDTVKYAKGVLLDIGCGGKPYRHVFAGQVTRYIGLEHWAQPPMAADLVGSGICLSIRDAAVDTIVATQVLEHLPDPLSFFSECARVLRPGGHLILTAPLVAAEHEEPLDFYRFTQYGLRRLAGRVGLEMIELRPQGGLFTTIGFLIGFFLWDHLQRSSYLCRNGYRVILLPVMALLLLLDKIFYEPRYTPNYLLVCGRPVGR